MTEPEVKHTEASMLKLLRQRHAEDKGNGPAWAYLEQVRSNAGFTRAGQTKTIDALALHLWESRGHDMHAYEVKVSRADFRTELRKPDKAEVWCALADYFWIVAPRGIVPKDELPATWGLIETSGEGLRTAVQAPRLREVMARADLTRGHLAAMLRAAGAGLSTTPDAAALRAAEEKGYLRGTKDSSSTGGRWQQMYEDQAAELVRSRVAIREVQEVLGVDLQVFRGQRGEERLKEVVEGLRAVLAEEQVVQRAKDNLNRAADILEQQAAWMREHAGRW